MRGESRQLIDEARAELTNVKNSLVEAIDELATSIRVNSVDNEADDSWLESASVGQRKSYALTGGRQTLTGSTKFRNLHSHLHEFNVRCREELHERLINGQGDLTNDELFCYHSTRAMVNELVKSIIECDILLWGGDTRWLVALRMAGSHVIPSVN